MDPYEQQLLTVFDSYDHEHLGSLDRDGLTQLCHTLQLDDQSNELIRCLLPDAKTSRATFVDFKDALLNLLGNMQHNTINKKSEPLADRPKIKDNDGQDDESPDREVSPRFVYGSKKYGRRSRPRSEELCGAPSQQPPLNDELNEQNDINYLNKTSGAAVQRSNSQSEVSNSKKRKTNYKLKRCTSLPAGTQRIHSHVNFVGDADVVCTEEMLREAWKKLGVGDDGYLNESELVLVCDAIGLDKLAKGVIRQLSRKLHLDFNRISFSDLLEALQEDDTWSDLLESPNEVTNNNTANIVHGEELFPDSRTFQYVTLGPDGNGQISADTLIEMWEMIGITAPKELIHELGFIEREVNIVELAQRLEREIKGMNDAAARIDLVQNPHLTLVQASLLLYQMEIRCLKNILEQMHAEREKLRGNVYEANNRAKLLAQEVDDNHVKMERNTQNQVKLLEQRHAEILKQVTLQYANEKEQHALQNQNLQEKIANLEHEVTKLKTDLLIAQNYSSSIEKENQTLLNKIGELQQVKMLLSNQVMVLETEKQKYVELEHEQLEPLLTQLTNLQLENTQLRDKNDEMVSEIENLTCQVQTMRAKVGGCSRMDENVAGAAQQVVVCEGVGLGAKRRSDYSPSKDTVLFGIADGSPRLGKVRKFQSQQQSPNNNQLDINPFSSNESGFDAEIDGSLETTTASTGVNSEQVRRLQAKIAFLEQVLVQHSIPVPPNDSMQDEQQLDKQSTSLEGVKNSESVVYLKSRVNQIETLLSELSAFAKQSEKCGDGGEEIARKIEMLLQQGKDGGEHCAATFEATIERYEKENGELKQKCQELENCVELLRNEYEKCEDYWQSKLDEERQIFEQEQGQSSKKLQDLINKMAEYEEQFAIEQESNRLPTIDETFNLEKQFTDLEQEFEEYKVQSENEIFKRDEEISILRQKLTELACGSSDDEKNLRDESVQATIIGDKMRNLQQCLSEKTDLYSNETLSIEQQQQSKNGDERDYVNAAFVCDSSASSSLSWNQQQQQNASSSASSVEKNKTPCRPKRTRKHDKNNCLYKKNNEVKKSEVQENQQHQQMVALPVSTIHGLNGRLHHLEQRCRQLQMVLKQQHFYSDQMLQQMRKHHCGEKMELQCVLRNNQEKLDQQVRICNDQLERLARSDMLVKELYVENSYLIAKVQRLEQQCHILAQYNANSSSV